jgi:hypothetical protein
MRLAGDASEDREHHSRPREDTNVAAWTMVVEKTQTLSYEARPLRLCGLSSVGGNRTRGCARPDWDPPSKVFRRFNRARNRRASTAETEIPGKPAVSSLEKSLSSRSRTTARKLGGEPASGQFCRPDHHRNPDKVTETEPVIVRNAMQSAGDYKLKWNTTSHERCLPSGNSAHRQSAGTRHTVLP